jgi:LysR family hydrogen peroxide-inducible transcriptional activator
MEIHQLRYLVTLADEGGFSRAAAKLHISQPSLSQQIKKLEDEVGSPLFDRLSKGTMPTQVCDRLLVHARRVLAELDEASRDCRDAGGKVAGPLAIGAIPTIAPFVLPRVLRSFLKDHPAVELEIVEDTTDRLLDLLVRGKLDLAILSDFPESRVLHCERILTEPLLLMVAGDHRLARKKRVAWSDLTGERMMVLHEMHCLGGQVSQFCTGHGLHPPIVMRGAQLSTLGATVASGLGVSIVPAMMAASDAHPAGKHGGEGGNGGGGGGSNGGSHGSGGHGVVYIPFADATPSREIDLAWNLLRYRSGPSRAFAQALQQSLASSKQPAS